MLRLTGRLGDGWLPSLGYLDLEDAADSHRTIDEAARRAGRDPSEVRRILNCRGRRDPRRAGRTSSRPWLTDHGFDTLILSVDDDDPIGFIRRLGEEVAPAVRERVG